MSLLVQKFGGSSVANLDRIRNVANKIKKFKMQGDDLIIVLSAMSGETDRLLNLAKDIDQFPNQREMDVLLSTGEQVTVALLSMMLNSMGIKAKSYTGAQVGIITNDVHTKAKIERVQEDKVRKDLEDGYVVVVAGFQGVTAGGEITTLGRGGSDTTAVALAAQFKADECQIYTDVDGVYTTDPRIEKKARKLDTITFEEMLELASLGSKVLQIRSVELAGKYNVPLRVLSSLMDEPGEGTLITFEEKEHYVESEIITGIALNRDETQITVLGVPDRPGIAFNILDAVGKENIDVDMIVQNISQDETTDFTFTVNAPDYDRALLITQNVANEMGAKEVLGRTDIAKLSVVGVGMRTNSGVASRMFHALAKEKINIHMISTSEIKVSVIIESKYAELAVRVLHEEFSLHLSH
ncbi:aspartate kinase [Wohlfahrtiimonas chitiniclastica]|uniref:Aspartokinase n=1 Tax=Wohlfahrtiimonas chitiniclastica TaxID=400946 RepID=A0AB35BXK2_9GAMM|nr:aspartate kinase [Wohlfahrtiimonas chitiniclastica]MBS7819753.1 aspartate kinase [Wohlfahrtiimonas chitiniclastica]MBS7823940.1 aspartate kinase [Wohlfahrtiimonas chitiniclastica]MBS7835372.1 aspartate kinase [Wohlfahrtiimonas chitiniclastica]MBS7839558.1 aspartate kinase [Wohlfahrtiimonas chitiniclastica]MDC7251522.1 aspartokinase [Wohlfahrtiimonas chitiniclastica]